MKGKKFLSLLALSAILIGGCSLNNPPKSKPEKREQKRVEKAKPVVKPRGISLSELKPSGFTNLALKGPTEYKSGEPIRFSVDTRDKDGYLYIIYEDSKGKVGVLYPNPNSPLSQMGGNEYSFPEDFGINPQAIKASKECSGCEKDKTVIYALLTDEPILDIHSINQTSLHNILGIGSSKNSGAMSKGLSVDFNAGLGGDSGNVKVGVFEFYVK